MSFWTDIRDAATAPFRAVGGLADDLVSGRNVFGSVGSRAGQFIAGSFGSPMIAMSSGIKTLAPSLADKPIIGEFVDVGNFYGSLASDARVSSGEFRDFVKGEAVLGAVAGGGLLAASIGGGAAVAGGVGSAYALSQGDVSQAFSTGFSTFAPQSLQDTVGDVKNTIAPFLPSPVSGNPMVPNYDYGPNYFPASGPLNAAIAGAKGSILPVLLVTGAALAVVLVMRKKRRG